MGDEEITMEGINARLFVNNIKEQLLSLVKRNANKLMLAPFQVKRASIHQILVNGKEMRTAESSAESLFTDYLNGVEVRINVPEFGKYSVYEEDKVTVYLGCFHKGLLSTENGAKKMLEAHKDHLGRWIGKKFDVEGKVEWEGEWRSRQAWKGKGRTQIIDDQQQIWLYKGIFIL